MESVRVPWVCVILVAHDSVLSFFWKRRKLCNKILPSQGHQFYVSNTWINQINAECVCVSVCCKFRCDFHEFSFCICNWKKFGEKIEGETFHIRRDDVVVYHRTNTLRKRKSTVVDLFFRHFYYLFLFFCHSLSEFWNWNSVWKEYTDTHWQYNTHETTSLVFVWRRRRQRPQ